MVFLVDEDVPVSVGDFLRSRGHEVHFAVDVLVPGSEDPLLARWADLHDAVIVTCNHKDFKALVSRAPRGQRAQFRKAGRLSLTCRQHRAVERITRLIESIEFEFSQAQRRRDVRVIIEISDTRFSADR
ncbi:MAG: DUF5615 family PIN-like protein [Candidatus Dormibacteraceae bacterium]